MMHEELENWASRAAQELQDLCDDAQEAEGNPDGENCLPSTRALIAEHSTIINGGLAKLDKWASIASST